LISANERQYQLPFCQVLAASGETILYTSTHGPFEKGKDIITRTPTGEIRAYQLKCGDVGLSEWRAVSGEVNNLVELAIEHVSAGLITNFTAYLVTNGELKDPVLEQVRVANVSWEKRGVANKLLVIQKGELLERFRAAHGAYLPRELADFRTFLELILRPGTFVAQKSRAAQLLEDVLSIPVERSKLDVGRAAASAVLLTAYITSAPERAENHWASFEYWVLAGAYILRLAEEHGSENEVWKVSFDLCEASAERAVEALDAECKTRPNLVEGGNPLLEGHTYSSRVTILAGIFAASFLRKRIQREACDTEFFFNFAQKHLRNASLWGESAIPFGTMVALELEQENRQLRAEELLIKFIRQIASENGLGLAGRGMSNPYYSPEEALRLLTGIDFLNLENFSGRSYCIETLVQMLARRWRRQALASLWFSITRIQLCEYSPSDATEYFRWHSTAGKLNGSFPGESQSWRELREVSEKLDRTEVPKTLLARPQFAPWFVLVYPHRFTPQIMNLIEAALWGGSPQLEVNCNSNEKNRNS